MYKRQNEGGSVFDIVQESKCNPAEALDKSPSVVQQLWANGSAIAAKNGSKEEGGKAHNAKHKSILQHVIQKSNARNKAIKMSHPIEAAEKRNKKREEE